MSGSIHEGGRGEDKSEEDEMRKKVRATRPKVLGRSHQRNGSFNGVHGWQ